MNLIRFLKDERFSIFFSFLIGVGIMCMCRPVCSGSECSITKAPTEKDFDKYVYRMGGGRCFEFKSEIVDCPSSGTIEAFRECVNRPGNELFSDQFSRRGTPIKRCE
jgi:hypothetical protein